MPKRGGKEKAPKGLSDTQIFALASEIKVHKKTEAEAKRRWKQIQDNVLVPEFIRRKIKNLGREGLMVTLVEPSSTTYDGPGIRACKAIKMSVKRRIFREWLNLSALTPNDRGAIMEILARIPVRERKGAMSIELDVDALSAEVQAGNIDPEVLDEFTTIKESGKYLNVSLGTDS